MGSHLSELLPLLYILGAGFAVFWGTLLIFSRNEDMKALSWASGNAPVKSSSSIFELGRSLTHMFTIHHAVKIKSPERRKNIEHTILISGMTAEVNVDEFIGMQLFWGVMLPIFLFILNFALDLGAAWWVILLFIPIGFFLPRMHLNAMRRVRVSSIQIELPFFIDLMALSTEAGLDFQGAMQRIAEKSSPDSALAGEFQGVLRDITLGSSRVQAMKNLAMRCDMSEISSFVNVVVDADQTGTSISKVLKDQSIQMRLERFVRAEKAGARASQMMLIPLMLFILPAVFVMIFTPVALQFMYGKS
jgi:tight adherence protein C